MTDIGSSQISGLIGPSGDAPATAVGDDVDPAGDTFRAAAWQSVDGHTWERMRVESGKSPSWLSDVVVFKGKRFAVGTVGWGPQADGQVWAADGDMWRVFARGGALGGAGEQSLDRVQTNGAVLVAIGSRRVDGTSLPAVWRSTDGKHWTEVDGGTKGTFERNRSTGAHALAGGPNGFMVVGDVSNGRDWDGIAWHSGDGVHWQTVDARSAAGAGNQYLQDVAADGSRWVVVGSVESSAGGVSRPAAWVAEPGGALGQTSYSFGLDNTNGWGTVSPVVTAVAEDNGVLYAIGGISTEPEVWRSTDGQQWTELGRPSAAPGFSRGKSLDHVAVVQGVPVVTMDTPAIYSWDSQTASWSNLTTGNPALRIATRSYSISSVATADTGEVAVGSREDTDAAGSSSSSRGEVWYRPDGGRWHAASSSAFATGDPNAVAPTRHGWVAVGGEDVRVAARLRPNDRGPRGLIWKSVDGHSWRGFGPNGEVTNGTVGAPSVNGAGFSGVAALGDGFVVVGTEWSTDNKNDLPVVEIAADTGGPRRLSLSALELPAKGFYDLSAVCTSGTTIVIAGDRSDGGQSNAFTRVSTDGGQTWRADQGVADFHAPGNQWINDCAIGPDGYVLVGGSTATANSDAKVWRSTDGIHWGEPGDQRTLFGGVDDQNANAVVEAGRSVLVAGSDSRRGDGSDAVLWRYAAGRWSVVDTGYTLGGMGTQDAYTMALSGNQLVVGGDDLPGAALWSAKIPANLN